MRGARQDQGLATASRNPMNKEDTLDKLVHKRNAEQNTTRAVLLGGTDCIPIVLTGGGGKLAGFETEEAAIARSLGRAIDK